MKHWLHLALTGLDNQTPDLVRITCLLSVLVFLFLSCWSVCVEHKPWDPSAYGTGLGFVIGATGAALWAKRDTEPKGGP